MAISATAAFDSNGKPIVDLNSGLPRIDRQFISIGGDAMAVFNGEYRIPIAGPLSVAAFYDAGLTRITQPSTIRNFGSSTVELIGPTNNVIRASTGAEVQFLLPMVNAPFRLIFAYNPQIFHGTVYLGTIPVAITEPRHDIKFTIGRSF
jgi:outer membrane protein assembly factor BamA